MSLGAIELMLGPLPPAFMMLVVAFVGIFFAIRRRHAHLIASRLTIAGLSAIATCAIGLYAVRIYSYRTFNAWTDAAVFGRQMAEIRAILHLVDTIGVILIVAAVFADRVPARSRPQGT